MNYSTITNTVNAWKTCDNYDKHDDTIIDFEQNMLPHGSGFDCGCTINRDESTLNKLVIDTSYHCLNENGYYDGWLEFQVIITPAFGNDVNINFKRQTKNKSVYNKYWNTSVDYFADCFIN